MLVSLTSHFPTNNFPIVANYSSWQSTQFLVELGRSIAAIAETTPGGILCFFPSYAALEAAVAAWHSGPGAGIGAQLLNIKGTVIVELRSGEDTKKAIAAYIQAVKGTARGALGLAVYRGKLSEGLSFNDDLCRAVICLGVPYPQARDPVVIAKRRWNDARRAAGITHALSGSEWYELQAYRAVNQALGRCLRHRFDYGALILLDARWVSKGEHPAARGLKQHLARWMQPFIQEVPAVASSSNTGLLGRLRSHFMSAPVFTAALQSRFEAGGGIPRQPACFPVTDGRAFGRSDSSSTSSLACGANLTRAMQQQMRAVALAPTPLMSSSADVNRHGPALKRSRSDGLQQPHLGEMQQPAMAYPAAVQPLSEQQPSSNAATAAQPIHVY